MAAFFIATLSIKNPEKFQEYAQKVPATLASFGGEFLTKGKVGEALSGSADHQAAAIVKFPDLQSVSDWYKSDAYQAIIPVRDEGADVTLISYEVPE